MIFTTDKRLSIVSRSSLRTGPRARALIGYGIAVAGIAAATGITAWVWHAFGPRPNPLIFFSYILAIMAAAWRGYGPGLFAVFLSHFVAPYVLLASFNPAKVEVSRVILSAFVAVVVSWVAATRRRTERMLLAANEDLERLVQERTKELEHTNGELRRKAAELERAKAELEQYTYVASHDLQEPARIAALYSQLLTMRYERQLDNGAQQLLGIVAENAKRMVAFTDSIVAYSRLVAQTERQLAPTAVGEVVEQACVNCREAISASAAEVTYGIMPMVFADRDELTRVFEQLLMNAITYRKPDVPPRISIDAVGENDMWIVTVRDNGVGLEMQFAEQIFKFFKRLQDRSIPGVGMGLAVCKKIIHEHGGRIWVESTQGNGATFKFTIPGTSHQLVQSSGAAQHRPTVGDSQLRH